MILDIYSVLIIKGSSLADVRVGYEWWLMIKPEEMRGTMF